MEKNNNNSSHEEIIRRMLTDRAFRLELVSKSHFWFSHFYFSHYITFETAEFHKEMFEITESDKYKLAVIVAFRGSGKSTNFTLSYPLWAILGRQQKKFVIILSQTQRQAKQHLINIKHELERNNLLLRDLGPFQEERDEWGGYSLVITKLNARITAASVEQSIRGLRHMQYRPDLIIADDIEDLQSVKTRESRNKTYNWLQGDVIPAGGKNTKIVIVGNLLHEDSVVMRLKIGIEENEIDGVFKSYPLINENGDIAWPGKYPNQEAIEQERRKYSTIAWQREFLLNIVPDTDQVIHPEWIHYYKELPDNKYLIHTATGVDLAISQNETADFTAAVSARVYRMNDDKLYIYILPNPLNERLTFPQTIEQLKLLSEAIKNGYRNHLYIEKVGYQEAIIQQLQKEGFKAEGIPVGGQDKRARLALITALLQNGQILFPERGAERLIEQLVGFGVENYDDLVDAFTTLILPTLKHVNYVRGQIIWLGGNPTPGWRRGIADW